MATSTEGVLLDAAADLVDDLHPQRGDVKGIQHVRGVGQMRAQRVEVAAERVQRRDPDLLPPRLGSRGEPVAVHAAGAALHDLEQPGRPARTQPDHAGGVLGVPQRVGPLPGVLVHAQAGHSLEPGRVLDQRHADLDDGTHHRPPAHAERAGHRGDGLAVGADPAGHPRLGPTGQ